MTKHSKTREFCGCETYAEDYESGMVVCWKCEQIVSHVDDEGAITSAWMQAEVKRMREALDQIARVGASQIDRRVARVALGGPFNEEAFHDCKCGLRPGRCNC